MGCMDHWHPVLEGKRLGKKPVATKVNGREIVLFRTSQNQIGALDDCCPHRRMRLSLGQVQGDMLQCPYHGWTFACDGSGESPGTPKLQARACAFEATEKHGVIWVKSAHSQPIFPSIDAEGFFPLCTLSHQVHAPLQITLDNFTEIEHTPTTHALFGYELKRMHEVKVQFHATETTTRVINSGPPKPLSWFHRLLLGMGKNYHFHDDWTTYFSPVYSVFDHWWSDPVTGKESKVRWRLYIFFTPVDNETTALMTFVFTKSSYPGPAGGIRLFRGRLIRMMKREIELDIRILENLADQSASLEGMKLSRFDRVLGMNRERIANVYHDSGLRILAA